MKIAVIAHALRAGGGTSIGANFVQSLLRIRPTAAMLVTAPDNSSFRAIAYPTSTQLAWFTHHNYLQRIAFDLFRLPRLLAEFRPDIVFCLGNVGLPHAAGYQVVLLHNPFLAYPRRQWKSLPLVDQLNVILNRLRLSQTLPHVDCVLCQTEVMKAAFLSRYRYGGHVGIMPNAVSGAVIHGGDDSAGAVRPATGNQLKLLALTRYYPHKNLEAIVDCFGRFRSELRDVTVYLTIAADQHPGARRLLRAIEKEGLGDRIINLGPIPQERLAATFAQMDGLLLPTLLESFSGAYLEAMHFQRPIITSDLDFARELCGEAALYFDPWSASAMRDAILALETDGELRPRLVQAGTRRLAAIGRSWDAIVETTMSDVESQMSGSGRRGKAPLA